MAESRNGAAMHHHPSHSARCPDCRSWFPDQTALDEHIRQEYAQSEYETHIHCNECMKPMPNYDTLAAHLRRNHPRDQNLNCPACGKHFVRISEVARHIEQKECPCLDPVKIRAKHDKKLAFARELQARHRGDYDEEVEAPYMSRNSALRPKADATVRPNPVLFSTVEIDQVDASWYHANVIGARRDAQKRRDVEAAQAAQSSKPVPAIQTNHQQPQLPTRAIPTSIEKWKEGIPRPGATLIDEFDPSENDKLQQSLIDYYDPSDEEGSARHGPWSAYFNPWENDDLVGSSRCGGSVQGSSPAASPVSTPRNQSPAAPDRGKSMARTVVTLDSSATVVPDASRVAANTQTPRNVPAPSPAQPSGQVRSAYKKPSTPLASSGRPATVYKTVMPLRNYKSHTASNARGSAGSSAQNSPVTSAQPSQAVVALKTPQSVMPNQKPSSPEPVTKYQALTPAREARAAAPAETENVLSMDDYDKLDDYDEVRKMISEEIARHDPRKPGFRAQAYYDARLDKYKCPIPQCFKSFKTSGSFEQHVGTHMAEKKIKYPCPGCADMFNSAAALIAHTESQSIRCQFRHSPVYGSFLAQAHSLCGMVDVESMDPAHQMVIFAISDEAKKDFGVPTAGKDDARRSRSDQFKAATAALEQRAMDEHEDKKRKDRKEWEEHERKVEEQLAKKREEAWVMQATKDEQEKAFKQQEAREKELRRLQVEQEIIQRTEQESIRRTEMERVQRAKVEEERKRQEEAARTAEEEAIRQAKERERKARDAERERIRQAGEQRAREAEEKRIQMAWEAEQERARQAKMERDREVQEQKKAQEAEQQRARQADKVQEQFRVQVKRKQLKDKEMALLKELERIREENRMLQDNEGPAMEPSRQAMGPSELIEDEIAFQKRVMGEKRDMSRKLLQEQEAREEAERRERIRFKMEKFEELDRMRSKTEKLEELETQPVGPQFSDWW